ncbi:TIGR02186 family protein [Pseudoruegeria sp. HB172150]|uniref:TIGR02186 family protein n=1 Tax=Pseudoruegeria sp. HB172150 TaxID=2721164 RepID=UPI0015539CE7|nr:TIGR02186 family protein [Pseudoruegeria sp. HB172150]
MIRYLLACLLLVAIAAPAGSETVVAGLSQNRISITANFDGSEILIFGAVKRFEPIPEGAEPLQIVITVAGPSVPVTVRRKERVAGIWVNTQSVDVDRAPVFYVVATSDPFYDVMSNVEDLRHKVSITRAIRSVGAPADIENSTDFTAALIRVRSREGVYKLQEGTVNISEETLFNTSVALPANLHEGDYTTRIFLTRDGVVLDQLERVIYVQKVGLERWLFNLSTEQPFYYGILSLIIAAAAGWGASAVFRYLKS